MTTFSKTSITLESCEVMLRKGIARSAEMSVPVVVVIVDEGGNLKALHRADGAGFLVAGIAIDKAVTAVNAGRPTADLARFVNGDDTLRPSMNARPGMSFVPGGLPIVVDGAVVGAIGVSGGHYTQDADIAQAALDAL